MADEQTRIFHLIEKKYITFCAKEKIEPNPQFFSKSIKSRQLWIDAVVDLCSGFPNRRLQLGFLENILQTGLSLNKEAIKKVIKFLLNAFESMEEHLYLNNAQYDSTLRCCGQLMVYCLTHSCAPTDSYMLFKEDVMDCIKKQITDSSTVECLIAYAVLFINLIKLERKTNYLFEALDMLNDEPDNTCPSDFSRNLSFLFKLFHSNEPRGQLSVLLAIVGVMSTDDWLYNYKDYGSCSLYILYVAGFATVDSSNHLRRKLSRSYDPKDSITNLLLSKLVYNWSKKNVLASNSGDCIKNVNHCDVFMDSLLTFCLEMKSNHFDAIRYSALDTFENIIVCHLVHCGDCCQPTTVNCALKISCDYLNEVLNRIVCDTCYSRGTIAMLTRFVRCIFKKNVYKTTNLLYSLQSVCDTHGCDTNLNNVCGQVVFGLMKIANDPNSASSISELYTLIAQRLWTENDPLINSWLEGLISVLVHRSNSTFHSTVNQNILPSLMKVNPKLLELLVKCCDAESVHKEVHLSMFLLTCCRLLSTNGAKTDVCKYLSLNFLKSSLGSYDDQLRLTALNVLVSFITKIKQMELLNEKLQLFLDYLRCDMWPNSKHFHSQIICAIKDVLMYILAVMKRGTTEINLGIQDGDIETFSIKMATILLSCIHPGSPAPRLSLGLAGLHTFIDCFYSVFHVDGDSEFMIRIMNCLNQAVTKLFPVVDLSNYQNALNCDKTNHSGLHVCSLLFIGLCSRYDADRDYAVKILLRLEFSGYLDPKHVIKLWTNTLETYAQSSKPDVSPIAGDLLRFLVYGKFSLPLLSYDVSSRCDSTLLSSCPSSQSIDDKAISAVVFLLDHLEEQILLCEKLPSDGLMAVVTYKPFYAMLCTIRAVIGILPHSGCQKKNDTRSIATQDWNTFLQTSSLFKEVNGMCIIERIISLGLRISEIVLPVVAHESPEGVLLNSQDDLCTDNKVIEDENDQLSKLREKTRKYPEYLILCCWRSVRELSLLMGISLVSYCNFSSTATEYQMQPNEIFRIAQFFCTQLLCCRHRGAFELCATGFTNFCIALVKHPGYYEIPVHWLNTITGQVLLSETSSKGSIIVQGIDFSLDACMGEHDTVECVTRRGAGCPLFVQAILGAELTRDLNGLTTLTNTVNWLLKSITSSISKIVNLQQSGYEATCVLNLNIIRGIFQSTNLNYHTNRYLQKGLIIALDGLGCGHLSIRNASMLFYSTIIQRIFGVTRSKEIKSRKNCLSTSTFFKLYPKFQQYLIETLTWYSGNPKILDTNRFKLYSILYLVTHLLPPPQVANVDEMLYKLLIRCGCDSGIRVRKIASLALTSIMHPNCIMKTLDHLLCLIDEWIVGGNSIKEWFITGRSNVLHSLLLQVYALLYSSMDVHSAPAYIAPNVCISSTDYASIIDRLKTSFSWLNDPKHVTCSVSRQLYMKILGHEYDHQPVTIKYGSYGLEREYAEACINTIVDREVRKLGDNTSAYIELIQLTKSLDSIELFTSFLRRIYLHIHAKLAHPVDCALDTENLYKRFKGRYYYNVELFDMTRRIFTFDSLFQVLFDFNRRYAHDSDGDDCILLLLNSINDESYHYIFELLAILIHSDNVSTDSVNRAIHWTSNQLKSIIKMIKVKAVNHFPFRNYFSFTSFIHFHINLIYVFAEKNVEQEHKQQQVVSTYYSQQHNHCYLNHIVELCELCRVCFDVFDDDDSTNACFEVKYAILHSLFLLDISVLNTIILNNENVEKVLQAFDVLIENITNPESSKLQKLACEITQNLLISSHPEYKCVLQLPYVLLPQLVSLLMQYNSEVIFKHMLRFVWEQMSSLTISRTQDPDGDNDDQGNTSDHAFPQTTFNPGCDTLESIKIMCNTLSSWLSVNSDSSSHPNKHILSIGGVCEDNEVLHGGNTFEEFESLLIRKPDFLASLYLNRYISSFRLTC